jgi:hypothetical protein
MKNASSVTGRGKMMSVPSVTLSKLEIIFCVFSTIKIISADFCRNNFVNVLIPFLGQAENNFVNALILFIRARTYKVLRTAVVIAPTVLVLGCGTANNDAPSLNTSGKHPAGWVAFNGGNHPDVFRAEPGQCPQCHGSDLFQQGSKGGVARVSCSSSSFNGIICHAIVPTAPPLQGVVFPSQGVSFSNHIQAIFDTYCIACHTAGGFGGFLPLTPGASYANLVGVAAVKALAGTLVIPRNSADSVLYKRVSGTGLSDQILRMPQGGPFLDTLNPSAIPAIKAWIDEGALNN